MLKITPLSKKTLNLLDNQYGNAWRCPNGRHVPKFIKELNAKPITLNEADRHGLCSYLWVWAHPKAGEYLAALKFINILILRDTKTPTGQHRAYWLNPENPKHHKAIDFFETHELENCAHIHFPEDLPRELFNFDDEDLLTPEQREVLGLEGFEWLKYDCTLPPQHGKISELRQVALDFVNKVQNKTRRLRRELHDTLVELENQMKLVENLSPQKPTYAKDHGTHTTNARRFETDPKPFEPTGSVGRKKSHSDRLNAP